jgi:hypothetical protein
MEHIENTTSSIVMSLSAAAERCLMHCCLAMAASIHSSIPAFNCHVTILIKIINTIKVCVLRSVHSIFN